MFNPDPEPKDSGCPVCGGDSFRFLGGNDVRCLLCSNRGTMDASSGKPIIKIERSDHEMFLSKADLFRHKNWLIGMNSLTIRCILMPLLFYRLYQFQIRFWNGSANESS